MKLSGLLSCSAAAFSMRRGSFTSKAVVHCNLLIDYSCDCTCLISVPPEKGHSCVAEKMPATLSFCYVGKQQERAMRLADRLQVHLIVPFCSNKIELITSLRQLMSTLCLLAKRLLSYQTIL